jgi:hypothetical protein
MSVSSDETAGSGPFFLVKDWEKADLPAAAGAFSGTLKDGALAGSLPSFASSA